MLALLPWSCLCAQEAEAQAEALIEVVRRGNPAEREDALRALSALGEEALPALRRAVRDPDPDLRFQLRAVLHARDGRLERLVRQVVEGRAVNAASYPEALQAYERIVSEGTVETRRLLVELVRANAAEVGERKPYPTVCLELFGDLVAREDAQGVDAADAARLCSLLPFDLRSAYHELIAAFVALPPELALPALRASLGHEDALVRVRAARVLAEVASAERAEEAATAIVRLLEDPVREVRRGALLALDLLELGEPQLIPVLRAIRDPSPQVAQQALRIAGERRLALGREPAEAILRDAELPTYVRREAARALGLIAQPAAGEALLPLARAASDHELRMVSAWALGAARDPRGAALLRELIDDDEYSEEGILYHGLARAGDPGLEELLDLASRTAARRGTNPILFGNERRTHALKALGIAREAKGVVAALEGILDSDPGDAVVRTILRSLGDLGGEEARRALARHLLDQHERGSLGTLLPLIAQVGAPADPTLRTLLGEALSRILERSNTAQAASALARVDPAAARTILRRRLSSPRLGAELARDFARSLARAGDPSQIERRALPYSQREVEDAIPGRRDGRMNGVGIDLLYARRYEEAILQFRRMLWCDPRYEIAAYNVACGYALQGNVDAALRYLRRCVRHGYSDPRHMLGDPDLDALRSDPRFQRLVQRLQLREETGWTLPDYRWPEVP